MVETGGLLPMWSTTAFWIPAKPLHLRSMLSKSMRCPENCNTHSQHWSTKRAQVFSMTTPNCTSHNQPSFRSWMNWATKFCLILCIHLTSHQPTTTSSSILTTFCRENTTTAKRRQKMLSKSLLNPRAWIFMLSVQFSSVQSLSRVRLFATPWIAACQIPLICSGSYVFHQ